MDEPELSTLLADELAAQDLVVTRRQLAAAGARPHDLKRFVRRRLLVPVHTGVYLAHTGPPTWRQRTWVAVLACSPGAALCWRSWEEPKRADAAEQPVHVAVDSERRIAAPAGVRLHRVPRLAEQVRWSASPPRLAPEADLLLRLERAEDETAVVRLLTDAVRGRSTTAARVRATLAARPRLKRRDLVIALLDDVKQGTHSVLEHRYLTHVERAHGLPTAVWQRRRSVGGRTEYADARYEEFGIGVELDGRAGHDGWDAENADAERDLDQAVAGELTVRLRHRQVYGGACRTAHRLGTLLQTRGWAGRTTSCGAGCGPT